MPVEWAHSRGRGREEPGTQDGPRLGAHRGKRPGKGSYSERFFVHGSAPNGPGRHRPRGEEQGVTLQERGGAGSRSRMVLRVSRGRVQSAAPTPTLDAILSPPSPPPRICADVGDAQNTMADSYSGPYTR